MELLQILQEIQKKLTAKLHWKIAEVEDGYKGDNSSLSKSEYGPENFPIGAENFPLNPSAPTEL